MTHRAKESLASGKIWSNLFTNDQLSIRRKHKVALVLGSGPSLNTVSDLELEQLKQHADVFAINMGALRTSADFWHGACECVLGTRSSA